MIFHLVTNVWGERHVALFLTLTLPNLLSSGNLPAMREFGSVRYRIFTTPDGRDRIEGSPLHRALAAHCEIEILTPLGARQPEVAWHVHWFHRAAAEARIAGALPVFVPPDTLWADGSLASFARRLAEGYAGVACPFILVAADSLAPCLEAFRAGAALAIGSRQMVRLALQHLHPLQFLAMPDAPHARPAFELHWPVDRTTMLSRYAVRELVAFDPRRCPVTFLWYAGGAENIDGLYFGADSDEMLMLSVDPVGKYLQNYILDHAAGPIDLARTTLHPLNDTNQTRVFIRRDVRLHAADAPAPAERRVRRRAEGAAIEMEAGRRALQIVRELQARGARRMARLLAIAVFETPLLRRWRREEPLHVVALEDTALDTGLIEAFDRLARPGNEPALMRFLHGLVLDGGVESPPREITFAGRSLRAGWEADGSLRLGEDGPTGEPVPIERTTVWLFDRLPRTAQP